MSALLSAPSSTKSSAVFGRRFSNSSPLDASHFAGDPLSSLFTDEDTLISWIKGLVVFDLLALTDDSTWLPSSLFSFQLYLVFVKD